MSKKKETMQQCESDFFAGLAKSVGGDILNDIDKTRGFIDSGVLALNYLLSGKFVGGGYATGAMHEVSGESATGKSLLGTNMLRGCQTANGIAVFHDAEHAISKDFAIKASKVDPLKLIVTEADTLPRSFNKIHKIIRQVREVVKIPIERPLCIVYDSIAVSASEREFAQTELDMEEATQSQIKEAGAGTEQPGERAKTCSAELRKLMPVVKEHNICLLFVNQLRKRIGVLWGDPVTEAGGGEALKYYCSSRTRLFSSKQMKNDMDRVIGMNVTFKNIKSRFTAPFQQAKGVHLFFDKGVDPFGGMLELMLQIGRIEATGGPGNYKVCEPWAGGREIKFKSSKERNDIPFEVFLECPVLVDAESPEAVMYYVNMFGEAHDAVETDVAKEEPVDGDG